jgi:hypothetical protein
MTNATRELIWSVLHAAFAQIEFELKRTMPTLRLLSGHSSNEAFLFRAYGEYWLGARNVVISFDIRIRDDKLLIDGDIAAEDGTILKDIMQVSVPKPANLADVCVSCAQDFADLCKRESETIKAGLSG